MLYAIGIAVAIEICMDTYVCIHIYLKYINTYMHKANYVLATVIWYKNILIRLINIDNNASVFFGSVGTYSLYSNKI